MQGLAGRASVPETRTKHQRFGSCYFNAPVARRSIRASMLELAGCVAAHDRYGVASSSIELSCCAGMRASSPFTYGEIAVRERRDARGNIARNKKNAPINTSGRIMADPHSGLGGPGKAKNQHPPLQSTIGMSSRKLIPRCHGGRVLDWQMSGAWLLPFSLE